MESNQNLNKLFRKFLDRKCSTEELQQLFAYFRTSDEFVLRGLIEGELERQENGVDRLTETEIQHLEKVQREIKAELNMNGKTRKLPTRFAPYVAAAAIIVIIGSYLFFDKGKEQTALVAETMEDVDPGTNRATLLLEDGESIVLDENRTGIQVGADGILYDDGTQIAENTQIQYVILSTPRKGQYQTVLPDGTSVWLNAESSLRYPTAFTGNERRVELTGEGYFEVAHNAEQPFIVEAGSQHLKVLGTEFNINAYQNEPTITTTLVDGSIALSSTTSKMVKTIKPAQQAILGADGFQITEVDVEPYIAWKNGEFRFKATPLHDALRQIERWYDIEIDYINIPKDIKVHSSTKRDRKLSSVLFAVEKITGLKFQVKERSVQLMR